MIVYILYIIIHILIIMLDRFVVIMKSIWFWSALAVLLYLLITAYHYTRYEIFTWIEFYNIANVFLSSFIISAIFYFIVVYIPSCEKRKMMKKDIESFYSEIRRELLREILQYSHQGGREDIDASEAVIDKLLYVKEFRIAFQGGVEAKEGFNAFKNYLQNKPDAFHSLVQKLQWFSKKLDYVAHNYEFQKQEHFEFVRNLEAIIWRLSDLNADCKSDEVKELSNVLWQMFAGWTGNEYKDYDIITEMISGM